MPKTERVDPYTGINRNQNKVGDDFKKSIVEFYGLVRRGEEQNILRRRRNWIKEGVMNYIDLWYMTRLFRSQNLVHLANRNSFVARQLVCLHRETGA